VLASAIKEDPGGNKIPLRRGEGRELTVPVKPAQALADYLMPPPQPRHPRAKS